MARAIGRFVQASGEQKRYEIDYAEKWLLAGEVLSTVNVTVESNTTAALTVVNPQLNGQNTGVVLWMTGGVDGTTYRVRVTVTSTANQTKEDFFIISVRDI